MDIDSFRTYVIERMGIPPETLLTAALVGEVGLDSLDMLELVLLIEDIFIMNIGGEIADLPYPTIVTLRDAYDYLNSLRTELN